MRFSLDGVTLYDDDWVTFARSQNIYFPTFCIGLNTIYCQVRNNLTLDEATLTANASDLNRCMPLWI